MVPVPKDLGKKSDYIEFWGGYYESSVFIVSN